MHCLHNKVDERRQRVHRIHAPVPNQAANKTAVQLLQFTAVWLLLYLHVQKIAYCFQSYPSEQLP